MVQELCLADELWMSGAWDKRSCGVCEMCICLARGGVGGEGGKWMRGFGLGFTNPVWPGECRTCVCVLVAVVWVM